QAYESVAEFMVFYNERRMHSSILERNTVQNTGVNPTLVRNWTKVFKLISIKNGIFFSSCMNLS
ncbi:hypothetical protein, partial [Heyndrickxia sporothermodurans]|uniref:hypothetical protein n=1 Tax=Heyndrickxia sporothermodurans TaxID=46224 RepID=UPI000A745371